MATLIRSLYNITSAQQGGVVTIGNFDGVHVGHQALMQRVAAKARALKVPAIVVTFEPHPFEFFMQENLTIPRITRLREKFTALADCGVDHVVVIPFNQQLASVSASDFVKEILVKALAAKHLIIGDDFQFGHKRQGNFALLQEMGGEHGFTVEAMPTIIVAGERVSSTRVRKALLDGNHALAAELLGHPYSMQGRVRPGDQLGRKLGFPTANIYLHRKLTPVQGVYTVLMHGIDSKPLPGAANVGTRPTIDGTRTLLEVHLLDFNQDIYGRYVCVEFCKKLREEVRYDSLSELRDAIANDVELAREFFRMQNILK